MSPSAQKRLALLAAALGIGLFVAANAHLVMVAIGSQPACTASDSGPAPARRAC
jgi:hypothetical protein